MIFPWENGSFPASLDRTATFQVASQRPFASWTKPHNSRNLPSSTPSARLSKLEMFQGKLHLYNIYIYLYTIDKMNGRFLLNFLIARLDHQMASTNKMMAYRHVWKMGRPCTSNGHIQSGKWGFTTGRLGFPLNFQISNPNHMVLWFCFHVFPHFSWWNPPFFRCLSRPGLCAMCRATGGSETTAA